MNSLWFLALVVVAVAQAQVTIVKVGNANGTLAFYPSSIQAGVGSSVQFQFLPLNHSVVSSTFDAPCVPATTGAKFFSGFQPVAVSATAFPTFSIQINDTSPIWLYCSQAKHCQAGMVAVINEDPTSSNTLSAFAGKAALAQENLSPGQIPSESSAATPSSSAASSQSSSSTISSSSPTTSKAHEPPRSPTNTGCIRSASSAASTSDKKKGGLSTGTAIGIGVGVTIGAVAMLAGAIVLWRSRRRRNINRNSNLTSFQQPHIKPESDDTQIYVARSEMGRSQPSVSTRQKRYALYAGQNFELDSRRGP